MLLDEKEILKISIFLSSFFSIIIKVIISSFYDSGAFKRFFVVDSICSRLTFRFYQIHGFESLRVDGEMWKNYGIEKSTQINGNVIRYHRREKKGRAMSSSRPRVYPFLSFLPPALRI